MKEFTCQDSLSAWEANAEFWDTAMGETSNRYHLEVVRPGVTQLLAPQAEDRILDAACGNGNYSAFLAELGATVTAFDYSPNMIAFAKKRWQRYLKKIDFHVADATQLNQLLTLAGPFDKAVSNMALMDITDIRPLFQAVHQLLKANGRFVFATQHPCFVTLTDQYLTPCAYQGEAIAGQPQLQCYYHRSLQDLFQTAFESGFLIDGFLEKSYEESERPGIIIVRAVKRESSSL